MVVVRKGGVMGLLDRIGPICREPYVGEKVKLLVLGRWDIERYQGTEPYALISITSTDVSVPHYPPDPLRKRFSRFRFHDTDDPELAAHHGLTLIDRRTAQSIALAVKESLRHGRLIVCQCDAGVSRSAGVAAAIAQWAEGSDGFFFREYCPNKLVRQLVLDALREGGV